MCCRSLALMVSRSKTKSATPLNVPAYFVSLLLESTNRLDGAAENQRRPSVSFSQTASLTPFSLASNAGLVRSVLSMSFFSSRWLMDCSYNFHFSALSCTGVRLCCPIAFSSNGRSRMTSQFGLDESLITSYGCLQWSCETASQLMLL